MTSWRRQHPEPPRTVKIGNETVESYDAVAAGDQVKAKEAAFVKAVNMPCRTAVIR